MRRTARSCGPCRGTAHASSKSGIRTSPCVMGESLARFSPRFEPYGAALVAALFRRPAAAFLADAVLGQELAASIGAEQLARIEPMHSRRARKRYGGRRAKIRILRATHRPHRRTRR